MCYSLLATDAADGSSERPPPDAAADGGVAEEAAAVCGVEVAVDGSVLAGVAGERPNKPRLTGALCGRVDAT